MSRPGVQTVRLVFDEPRHIRHIRLRFVIGTYARTHEFVLRWLDATSIRREIVRLRWNFSAGGSVEEVEDYQGDLIGVTELELVVTPDVSCGDEHASLAEMRLA